MSIERFLQLSLSGQIVLAAFLLFLGQGLEWIALAVALFVLVAFLVVDKYKLFQLNPLGLNILTLLVAGFCVYNLFFYGSPFQIVSNTANGLLLMELILLLRRKTFHTYWLIFLLSFFQVVVGSAFRQQTTFGILLLVFVTIALISLSALTFYRQAEEPTEDIVKKPQDKKTEPAAESPLQSSVRNAQQRGKRFPFCFSLTWKLIATGLFSLLVSVTVFLLTPRFGEGSYLGFPGSGSGAPASIGFNDVIRLGELGPRQKDSTIVCQVKLFEGDTDAPAQKPIQLYLRGVTVNSYENRQWRFRNHPYREPFSQPDERLKQYVNLKSDVTDLNQDSQSDLTTRILYSINPTGRLDAFAVWPFYPRDLVQFRMFFTFNALDQRLSRREFITRQRHAYEFYAPSVEYGVQVEITPKLYPQEFASLIQMPKDDNGDTLIPSARKLADRWLEEAGLSVENDGVEKVARQLCRKLRDSGEYAYSLNPQTRNRNLDPLEDFLSEHKVGHCEFFASALTMLLRSLNVPAQPVIGYVTNEYSKYGEYFTVRQRHAHAWVEVWIPSSQLDLDYDKESPAIVTADNFNSYKKTWSQSDWRYGGWLRLDPTPSVSQEETQINVFVDWFGSMFDWMNVQWEKYIIKMDPRTQQTQVYDPIYHFWGKSPMYRWFHDRFGKISIRAVLTALIIFFIGLYWTLKLLNIIWKWLQIRFKLNSSRLRAIETRVEFYRRFEKALRRRGFTRRADQTPLEFALELEELPQFANWTIRPKEIAMKYYAVRYGGETASAEWIRSVRANLRK
ncbi:MAG: DUF3488 domain-containing protein [Thermoguttaceae bacterium]|nr:DUF3488 domain-containing protein [Thermoguttaceae bacterium]